MNGGNKVKDYLKLRIKLNRSDKQLKLFLILGFILITCLFFFNQLMSQKENMYITNNLIEQKVKKEERQKFLEEDTGPSSKYLKKQNIMALKGVQSFLDKNMLDYLKYEIKMIEELPNVERINLFGPSSSSTVAEEHTKKTGFDIIKFFEGKKLINSALIENETNPDSLRYGTKNWTFILSLQGFLTSVVGVVYFLITFSFNHFKDFEKENIKLLGTQPLKREKIFLCNFILFFGQSFIFYITIVCYGFILSSILGGKISMNYPIMTNQLSVDMIFRPVWYVVLITSLLFLGTLLFSYLLLSLIMLFFRKLINSIMLTLLLLMAMSFISLIPVSNNLNKMTAYNPFIYLNPREIFIHTSNEEINKIEKEAGIAYPESDGKMDENHEYHIFYENVSYFLGKNTISQTRNSYISWEKGIFSLLASSVVLISITSFTYKKRMCI